MAKTELIDIFRERGLNIIFLAQQANETARNWAYRLLFENIIHLNLPPGAYITEQELADVLRVSRTPIREALIQLSHEDFIEITSQRGTRISLIDAERIDEDRYLRMCLEQKTAQLACACLKEEWLIRLQSVYDMQILAHRLGDAKRFFELDEEFHHNIFVSCGKSRLFDVIRKFGVHLIRARMLSIASGFPCEWAKVLEHHARILDAFKNRDPQAAGQAMETHLVQPVWNIRALQEKFPDYFVSAT